MQILENIFNKNTVNIMLDIETLGTTPGCKVLSIGLAHFTESGVVTSDEFYPKITAQVGHEDSGTLEWWGRQSEDAKTVFVENLIKGLSVNECADKMRDFIDNAVQHQGIAPYESLKVLVWGNGASFDNVILAQLFRDHDCKVPWNTFGDRCYRTVFNLLPKADVPVRAGTHHRAVDDACYQAEVLISALNNASKQI